MYLHQNSRREPIVAVAVWKSVNNFEAAITIQVYTKNANIHNSNRDRMDPT